MNQPRSIRSPRSATLALFLSLASGLATLAPTTTQARPDSPPATLTVTTLANDPDFALVTRQSIQIAEAIMHNTASMDAAELAEFQASLEALAQSIQSEPSPAVLRRVTQLTGLTQSALNRLVGRFSTLNRKFPTLDETGPALIGQAVEANEQLIKQLTDAIRESHPQEPENNTNTGNTNNSSTIKDCEDECHDAYESTTSNTFAGFVFAGVLCLAAAPAGGPIGYAICVAGAAVEAARELAVAEENLDDCIAICNGETPDCHQDSDCPPNDYCWTGVAGVGENECRPEKALDKTCSRDGQCISGCCKYDFWTNPVSQVCRPANKCN